MNGIFLFSHEAVSRACAALRGFSLSHEPDRTAALCYSPQHTAPRGAYLVLTPPPRLLLFCPLLPRASTPSGVKPLRRHSASAAAESASAAVEPPLRASPFRFQVGGLTGEPPEAVLSPRLSSWHEREHNRGMRGLAGGFYFPAHLPHPPSTPQVGGHTPCARVRQQSLVCKPLSSSQREYEFYQKHAPQPLEEFLPRYFGVRSVEFVSEAPVTPASVSVNKHGPSSATSVRDQIAAAAAATPTGPVSPKRANLFAGDVAAALEPEPHDDELSSEL